MKDNRPSFRPETWASLLILILASVMFTTALVQHDRPMLIASSVLGNAVGWAWLLAWSGPDT